MTIVGFQGAGVGFAKVALAGIATSKPRDAAKVARSTHIPAPGQKAQNPRPRKQQPQALNRIHADRWTRRGHVAIRGKKANPGTWVATPVEQTPAAGDPEHTPGEAPSDANCHYSTWLTSLLGALVDPGKVDMEPLVGAMQQEDEKIVEKPTISKEETQMRWWRQEGALRPQSKRNTRKRKSTRSSCNQKSSSFSNTRRTW